MMKKKTTEGATDMGEPTRTCVACRTARPQAELLRMRAFDGQVVSDRSARTCAKSQGLRSLGRSAYLCPSRACFAQAARRGAFARALGRPGRAAQLQRVDAGALWSEQTAELERQIDLLTRSGPAALPRTQRLAALAAAMRASAGRAS